MISVQYPHFTGHPFGNMMSDSGLHSGMHNMSKNDQEQFGLGADLRAKSSSNSSKKRPSRAGTRSVSTLTQAQLERKRANDREAQRAIRQRTKDHIDALERQIRELAATSDSSGKLMQAMQRNQELEQENALLRSRLSSAVTTMSEHGLSSDHIMLSNSPNSPTRRIKLATQIRTSTTPAPRSIPTPTMPPGAHQEQWGSAYSPASTSMDRSPSIADVSPVVGQLRWTHNAAHGHPPAHEAERNMHPGDPGMQPQAIGYGYTVDSNGRPVQPVQPVSYHSEPQMMPSYTQPASPVDYQARHAGPTIQNPQAPAYSQYSSAPQGYMPHSPHDPDPHMHMMHRQNMMYIPQNMKAEQ